MVELDLWLELVHRVKDWLNFLVVTLLVIGISI